MQAIMKQSIECSFRENITAYPESYPISDNGPSDDALASLVSWVENSYLLNDNTYEDWGGRGALSEWFEIALRTYVDYFDFKETYNYCKERIGHFQSDLTD